jgi:hypothetical protein
MDIKFIGDYLNIQIDNKLDNLEIYRLIRKTLFERFYKNYLGTFQSPSISASPVVLRGQFQAERSLECYLRFDFNPSELEEKFNEGHKPINFIWPKTLFFNGGMSAITTLAIYLAKEAKTGRLLLGQHTYYEVKHILRRLFAPQLFTESEVLISDDTQLIWFDYPTNSDDKNCFIDILTVLSSVIRLSKNHYDKEFYLVIDYTVSAFGFSLEKYLDDLPNNLHIFLVSSIQKHMTYGFDIGTGGALTIYSRTADIYDNIMHLRGFTGSLFNEQSFFLLPNIEPEIVKQIVVDSGKNAQSIVEHVKFLSEGIDVQYTFTSPESYNSSLVLLRLDRDFFLHKREKDIHPIDKLVHCILAEAKRNQAIIVNGASFGFPMTRIQKNGGLEDDVRSLRIAAGYDEEMNKNILDAIVIGIQNFIHC